MFTFWSGLSIGIVLGVVLWNAGARLGNAIVGTPSASYNTQKLPCLCLVCKARMCMVRDNVDINEIVVIKCPAFIA